MRKITVKRLMYHSPNSGRVIIGGCTYDGNLTDENILGSVHELGKTQWINGQLWLMRDDDLLYRITVESFTQYQRTWFDTLRKWFGVSAG